MLNQLKAKIHHSQDEAVQKATKKVKHEKGVMFQKKGY